MGKSSGWLKWINFDKDLRNKTHKVFDGSSIYQDDTQLLAAKGAGTLSIRLEKHQAFNLDLIATNALLRLMVNQDSVKLYCIYRGRFILLKEDHSEDIGLEADFDCTYWLSFDARSRTVLFGKHQPKVENIAFAYRLPRSNKSPGQYWMNNIAHYRIGTPATVVFLSKDMVKKGSMKQVGIDLASDFTEQ